MGLLQEGILAEAEMIDLTCDPSAELRATVIEARNVPGLGACATVIVRQGTLRPGMFCATETAYTRVRSLNDTNGSALNSAGPSYPCEITGWKDSILPVIGSQIVQFPSETECKRFLETSGRERELIDIKLGQSHAVKREALDRQLLQLRKERARDLTLKPIHIHSYDTLASGNKSTKRCLEIILHADVTGSLEALQKAICELPRDKVQVRIVSSDLGPPIPTTLLHLDGKGKTDSCVLLAFNVPVPKSIEKALSDRGVKMIREAVIYHLLDEVKAAMTALLPPVETETVQAVARVLQLFPFGKEIVAGCTIEDGLFLRSNAASNVKYALERGGRTVWSGPIKTLRHLKRDIAQAQKGMECGIVLEGLDPSLLQVNDLIKCVKITLTAPQL